jgi:hypothetical protein
MKKVLITQSNYIPWKGYFDAMNLVDEVILYDSAQYTKRDWRNRNVIQTERGPAWLTIPVLVKGKFDQKIRQTKVSEEKWNEKHWKTLRGNYSRATHFNEMSAFIENLYRSATMNYLSEINYWFLSELSKWMNINTPIIFCDKFDAHEDNPSERLVSICKQTEATHYYTGPAAKSYLEEDKFANENIQVCYLNYENYKEYPQLYTPFNHNVSILDLLFNTGSNFSSYMKQNNS